jgi:hypothetical protein
MGLRQKGDYIQVCTLVNTTCYVFISFVNVFLKYIHVKLTLGIVSAVARPGSDMGLRQKGDYIQVCTWVNISPALCVFRVKLSLHYICCKPAQVANSGE